jgi:hypothetical protein
MLVLYTRMSRNMYVVSRIGPAAKSPSGTAILEPQLKSSEGLISQVLKSS